MGELSPRYKYGTHSRPVATPDLKAQAQRVNDMLHPEPDYQTDPTRWQYWMRQIAHAACIKRGFVNTAARTTFMDEVFKVVIAKGHMGDKRWFLRIMRQQLNARGYGRKSYAQNELIQTYNNRPRTIEGKHSPFGEPIKQTTGELAARTAAALATIAPKVEDTNVTTPAATKPSELDEALDRKPDGTPADDAPAKQHETNPDRVPFAVTNHIKRETGITAGVGTFIAKLFPGGLDADKVRELGAGSVWATVEAAVADYNAKKDKPATARVTHVVTINAPAEPPAPAAAETSANSKTQEAASTGQETAKSEQGVSTATPPTTNAPERPVSPKKDGTTVSDAKDEIRAKYTKKLQGGKEYLEVQGRVLLFRLDHPDWSLETDVIAMTDDAAIFKCTIRNADGRIISTGHGRATAAGTKNLGSRFVEKGETASIGRALALAGYGNDDSLEDSDYLADSPVVQKAA